MGFTIPLLEGRLPCHCYIFKMHKRAMDPHFKGAFLPGS